MKAPVTGHSAALEPGGGPDSEGLQADGVKHRAVNERIEPLIWTFNVKTSCNETVTVYPSVLLLMSRVFPSLFMFHCINLS